MASPRSVVRYGYVANPPKKPKASLDPKPLKWSKPGLPFDLYEDSQEPFNAKAWQARREKRELEAADEGTTRKFTKMDLQAVILSKGLKTKEAVLAYTSKHGSDSMKVFVKQVQRKLKEHIEDAEEWISAPAICAAQSQTEWDILCRAAEEGCPHGDDCIYAKAAFEFFRAHAAGGMSQNALAACLRNIVMHGPSKDVRVPFLVGTTNTGKSTLVESFDDLFGESAVFHLPAITDTKYALRNWLKNKRFVFWDEYEPVPFAAAGVIPRMTFCKAFNAQLFEVQVPQNAHDGNVDFRWTKGAVFTSKAKEIWTPRDGVTDEDVRHMCARCEMFPCTGAIRRRRGGVPKCRNHLALWVRDGAAAFDAQVALGGPQPGRATVGAGDSPAVTGLRELLEGASIPPGAASALALEIEALGTIHVQELGQADWCGLHAWAALREMERRRILARVQA